jgi:hypothetical protein
METRVWEVMTGKHVQRAVDVMNSEVEAYRHHLQESRQIGLVVGSTALPMPEKNSVRFIVTWTR